MGVGPHQIMTSSHVHSMEGADGANKTNNIIRVLFPISITLCCSVTGQSNTRVPCHRPWDVHFRAAGAMESTSSPCVFDERRQICIYGDKRHQLARIATKNIYLLSTTSKHTYVYAALRYSNAVGWVQQPRQQQ